MKASSARRKSAASGDGIHQQIGAQQRDAFAAICSQARDNLTVVIDMILIHNEQVIHGNVPRASLNKPIVIFSAAAWERMVTDLRYLSAENLQFEEAGKAESAGAYLGPGDGRGKTLAVLAGASGGHLPKDWLIRLPTSGSGKTLHFAVGQCGIVAALEESVAFWIRARNNVVHRQIPDSLIWAYESGDAGAPDRKTFNTTLARIAMTTFLQLIDQTIQVIADTGQMTSPEELWLPQYWLEGQLRRGERGVVDKDQLHLWYGRPLVYNGSGT